MYFAVALAGLIFAASLGVPFAGGIIVWLMVAMAALYYFIAFKNLSGLTKIEMRLNTFDPQFSIITVATNAIGVLYLYTSGHVVLAAMMFPWIALTIAVVGLYLLIHYEIITLQ